MGVGRWGTGASFFKGRSRWISLRLAKEEVAGRRGAAVAVKGSFYSELAFERECTMKPLL